MLTGTMGEDRPARLKPNINNMEVSAMKIFNKRRKKALLSLGVFLMMISIYPTMASSEMRVTTKDGRTHNIPVASSDIKSIEFTDNLAGSDFTGEWEMVANISYQFLLKISQQGDRITGTMTRTNGTEPVDRVTGLVLTNGTFKFTRQREGAWRQDYTGGISRETGILLMKGTFSHDGSGSYTWQAKRAL